MEQTLYKWRDGSFDSSVEGAHIAFCQYTKNKNISKKIKHIIIQHGVIEYHKRHEELIQALIDQYGEGVVISCMDLVGHGYSGGSRAYIDDFKNYINDFLKFTRVCTDIYRQREVETSIIAHSLGAMIILRTLIDYRDQIPFSISKLILSNPCIRPKITLPKFVIDMVDGINQNLEKMRVPSLYGGKDLTRDKQRAIDFDADHLNSDFITVKLGIELLKESKSMMSSSYFIKTPILFLLSTEDKIVDTQVTRLFISGIDEKLVCIKNYEGAFHDLLNETCRKEVFYDIIEYLG